MRKARTFLILGIWVAVLPYLGFPQSWKNILFSLSGLCLAYLGYIMRQDEKGSVDASKDDNDFGTFKENNLKKPGVVRHPVRSVDDTEAAYSGSPDNTPEINNG